MTTPGEAPTTVGRPVRRDARRGARHSIANWVCTHSGLVVLLLVPFIVLAMPELAGRAFIDGDNFLQNLPLRALVGRSLDHGALPLWDPYLFSGTPLLGGFNAGAAYPTTWLMAVLPLLTAWTINLALVYDVALVGMYLFLRRQPIGSTAATFGAATFAFGGYMTAQIVHVDIIQSAAWLPWMLVAVHELTGRTVDSLAAGEGKPARRRARGWVALLALALGMSTLTGGAEAIIDGGVLVAIFWIGRLITQARFARGRRRSLAWSTVSILAGVTIGLLLGTAQWLPGLAFQMQSQRASANYAFFGSGSLPGRLVTLIASPFVLGTNQNRLGFYAGTYNFQEVTSYVGILALIGGCSLFLRKWRTRPEARSWWVWYVVLGVGLLSALGTATPFGHVLYLIPLIKNERLLSRNLLLVDFSLAVLLGWWVHLLLSDRGGAPQPDPIRLRWRPGRRAELIATCAPLAVISALCAFSWIGGPLLDRLLRTQVVVDAGTRFKLAGLVTGGALIAAVAAWVVLSERHFSTQRLRRLLAGVLAVDLIVFNVLVISAPTTATWARAQGSTAASFASLVGNGRFLIYDPDQFYGSQLYALGQTDLNVYNSVSSGQGYTALTDGNYYSATGAHYQEDLDPTSLAGPVWDELNVSTLLSLPSFFVTPLPAGPGNTAPGPPTAIPFPATPSSYNGAPAATTGPVTVAPGHSHRWYFGGMLTVTSLAFGLPRGAAAGVTVGLVTATGAVEWLPPGDATVSGGGTNRTVHLSFGAPVRAGGLIVRNDTAAPLAFGIPTAHTAEAGAVALDGPMQYGVDWPHWKFTGTIGSFGVFENTAARGWAWAGGPGGGAAPAGAQVSAPAPGLNGEQQIIVHVPSAMELNRSVSWTTGWHATVQALAYPLPEAAPGDNRIGSSGRVLGPARSTAVLQHGTIQRVLLAQPGDYLVTFDYSPTPARIGLATSALTAVGLVLWAVLELVSGRRWRRRERVDPEPTEAFRPG